MDVDVIVDGKVNVAVVENGTGSGEWGVRSEGVTALVEVNSDSELTLTTTL